jgi:response regulator RpfG family c-di-GMP phosphodiesterase
VALKNQSGEVLGAAQVLNRMDGKPFDDEDRILLEALASLAAMAIETVQLYEEQSRATEAVISGLMIAVEMRDPKLILHSQEVRAYARGMAAAMNLPEEEIRRIERAAALHDIGKIAVPDRVLTKDKPLTADERAAYEDHALYAKEFLETMKFSGELAGLEHIAPYHHKRFAGGGFPAGPPEGADIPLGARIIAVADELAVLMRSRWGRRAMSQGDAIRSIRQRAGTDFDPEPVAALFQLEPQLEEIRHRVFSGVVGHLGHETQ